ncbi:hypothetical protein N0V82_003734 [Gnomoniopsis sp. IMI 355080]|nr:hypothetical protein N0V82_003734 [Gnomoniopsis sp. IMI 355080]
MPGPEQEHQGGLANARLSRPNLTLDTQRPLRPLANDLCAQSAPVGTRQEKGITPMYQAGDRHCAKLAEMMDSPTWRSQDPVPYVGSHDVQHPLPPNEQGAQATGYHKKYVAHFVKTTDLLAQDLHNGRSTEEVLHLGRCGDDIEILGIQPFIDTPETSDNTFIISATISQNARRPYEAFRYNDSSDHENSPHSPLPSATAPGESRTVWLDMGEKLEDNAQKAMEQDEAIQSINNNLRSPKRRRQATSDEQQRFRGLLDRLHQRHQRAKSKEDQTASLIDPAIISFVPKKADPSTPTKRSTRSRSDSGYASPTIFSRPSTRTQSRTGRDKSDSVEPDTVRIDHQKAGSHDSGFDESPSKNSVLNPTAKAFSVPSVSNTSSVKKGLSIRPPLAKRVFVPSQQVYDRLGALPVPQACPTMQSSQGPWYPPQPNINNPPMAFASVQQGAIPGMLPPWTNITGPGMSSAATMSPVGLPPFSGPVPGLGQAPGFGLAGLTASPGLGAANLSSPFHQQLSSLGLCCNVAHQAMSTFSPPAFNGVMPPALAPQIPGPSAPLTGLTPSAAPFIPKNVPKPKVPNTTGQQTWELMHELRRMNEPGYAQRCKEKQKKRYIKQLEKTSGQH